MRVLQGVEKENIWNSESEEKVDEREGSDEAFPKRRLPFHETPKVFWLNRKEKRVQSVKFCVEIKRREIDVNKFK